MHQLNEKGPERHRVAFLFLYAKTSVLKEFPASPAARGPVSSDCPMPFPIIHFVQNFSHKLRLAGFGPHNF